MTVRELYERMEYTEFLEWTVIWNQDPWGELRADRRTALLATQFYNAHRARNAAPAKLDDFMLYRPFEEIEQPQQAGMRLLTQARAYNARRKALQQWRR